MRLGILSVAASVVASAASADLVPLEVQPLTVPSGQPVMFSDTVMNEPGPGYVARFRFVAPELADWLEDKGYEVVEADMEHLCVEFAVPRISPPLPSAVIISLAEEETPFGEANADVLQVFESYQLSDGNCEWEAF